MEKVKTLLRKNNRWIIQNLKQALKPVVKFSLNSGESKFYAENLGLKH